MIQQAQERPGRTPATASRLPFWLLPLLATFAGLLTAPLTAQGSDLTSQLSMHYMHQYLGNASDDYDCGPTSVAMVLDAYGLRPSGLSNAAFVASIRRKMGLPPYVGTVYADLERAFDAYDLHYSLIPSSLPGEPDAEVQLERSALDAGNLVIAMVHGTALGRGDQYGDHWQVLVGMDGDKAHVYDPDDQTPRWDGWIRGGDITLPVSVLEQAMLHAQPGPYAIVINRPSKPSLSSLQVGMTVHIGGTDGDGANLRSSPRIADDNTIEALSDGTAVTIAGPLPPPNADGHDWIGVTVDGQQGYVASEFIQTN